MRKSFSSLLLTVLALLLAQAGAGAGRIAQARVAQQASAWSAPMQISQTEQNAWFPDVIADKTGRVHVVWAGHESGYDTVYYRNATPAQGWSPQTDVFAEFVLERQLQEATRPALALDQNGFLLMTNRVENVYFSKAPAGLAANVSTWSAPRILNTGPVSYFSRMAVDSRNHIHAFITQNVPTPSCQICMHLFYRRSEDAGATWSVVQDISLESNGVIKPQVVVDKQDHLHVIWEAGVQGGTLGQAAPPSSIYYAVSRDGGMTWSDPLALTQGTANNYYSFPAIGVDSQGRIVVVWLSVLDDLVYFQISQDGGVSWSAPTLLPGLFGAMNAGGERLDSYSMAGDSAGQLHLVMAGRVSLDQRQAGLYHIVWDGSRWSQPETIVPPTPDTFLWPRVAVGLGNQLHVVYTYNAAGRLGLGVAETGSRLDIFYTQAPAEAPAEAPAAYPTPTAAPIDTPAPVVMVEPTAAVLANTQVAEVGYRELMTEVDDYASIALSVAPALVILSGIMLMILMRRRR